MKDNLTDRISKIGESVEIVPRLQEEVVDLRAKLELVTEQLKKTNQKSKKERKLPNGVSVSFQFIIHRLVTYDLLIRILVVSLNHDAIDAQFDIIVQLLIVAK